jgi:phage gp16-like protein
MRTSAALRTINRLKAKCRAIHVARRQLELDDATYRATLKRAAGVRSSSEINTLAQADAVLDAMTKLGFQHKPKITPGIRPGTPATLDKEPYLQKIEAMLADMELPWSYAEKIAENITGGKKPEAIKRLAWVRRSEHLRGIIAALHNEKKKRLVVAMNDLGQRLAMRGLKPQWARNQAEDMGRLNRPWTWHECLETLRLIVARLEKS